MKNTTSLLKNAFARLNINQKFSYKYIIALVIVVALFSILAASSLIGNSWDFLAAVQAAKTKTVTVTLSQDKEETITNGVKGETFVITWVSKNASSCTLNKEAPDGERNEKWAKGASGSEDAAPYKEGVHKWWIDCVGKDGKLYKNLATLNHTVKLEQSTDNRPNIIVVMTDDQSLYTILDSNQNLSTNIFGNLIKNGTTFTNSFVVTSQCDPSRATFMTGQYPHNHGILTNDQGYSFDHSNTLSVWLQNAGYKTSLVGKYFPLTHSDKVIEPGWDNWIMTPHAEYYNYSLNENGKIVNYGSKPSDYSTNVFTDHALKFINQSSSTPEPFFLWLTLKAPHGPYIPESKYDQKFSNVLASDLGGWNEEDVSDKPKYIQNFPRLGSNGSNIADWIISTNQNQLEALLSVRDAVDKIVSTLRENGELENTYIIFTSDNGFMRGQHRITFNKIAPYDPSVQVPLIVVGPNVPKNKVRNELVANIDLAPTILELAGASGDRVMDGKSLVPLITSTAPNPSFRQNLVLEFLKDYKQQYPQNLRNKVPDYIMPAYTALKTADGFKYIKYLNTQEEELYDRSKDIYELTNVASQESYSGIKSHLKNILSEMQNCSGTACRD